MPEIITTTVSAPHRSITVLYDSGESDRYALVRARDGDVHWRHDTFVLDEREGLQWSSHGGRLTVGEVLARAPQCAGDVHRWTREEIEDGPDLVDVDIFARDARRRALERLEAELEDALARS